ncbi:N-acetylglucosamine related transporter, NagX [hydrothermal vent metagenome]|uniref:N-acetylglucosamine related transporter, NagX n=1 Tax=hydrothermal vent metagenome TaxID=652676 RepID=A0A3B0UDP4_9ZZZZ
MENKSIVQSRLLSLDFFRGLTMFLLITEFTNLFGSFTSLGAKDSLIYLIGEQFHHHPWNGLRFWDLIQPFFMFIVGVAMPLSFSKRIKRGEPYNRILKHIAKRSFLLLVLGWALGCISSGTVVFLFQNVLAQLSVTIMIAFLIMRKPAITQIAFSIGLLALTEFIYRIFWVEGFNQPFVADHNFGAWVDMLISGRLSGGHWVSFNAIPTTAHTIWGVLAGQLLMSNKTNKRKLLILVIAGIAGLIIGYGLNPVTPIIKRISTSSFVFASGGWALLALAASYWLIDMMKFQKGVLFFAVVGMNPLFIYLFAHVGGARLIENIIRPFTSTIFSWAGGPGVNIITSSLAALGLWYICYWMYKQKLFIKI